MRVQPLRRAALTEGARDLLVALGVVATGVGLLQALVPGTSLAVWFAGAGLVGAVVFAAVRQRPRAALVARYPGGPWTISVLEGDVLDFDPAIITVDRSISVDAGAVGASSLVAQLVEREFDGDAAALAARTRPVAPSETLEAGLLVPVSDHQPERYLLTCSRKGSTGSELTFGELWRVYEGAWDGVRHHALDNVAMPLVGSGFSRSALPDVAVLMTLLASLHGAAIERPVCADIKIVVPERRLTAIGAHHVKGMLEGLGYEVTTRMFR